MHCVFQEHVGWEHAHVIGHSMGAMVALKLASAHPERVDSLTLISTTGGHFESIPRSWRALWYAFQVCAHALPAKPPICAQICLSSVSIACRDWTIERMQRAGKLFPQRAKNLAQRQIVHC